MPDCRLEEYFLPDTPESAFGDEKLQNLIDAFIVHGPWHGTGGEHIERTYMHEAGQDVEQTGIPYWQVFTTLKIALMQAIQAWKSNKINGNGRCFTVVSVIDYC